MIQINRPNKKPPRISAQGLFVAFSGGMGSLAVTYFRMGNPHYHRRSLVSRPCSRWEGVGPRRYGRQTKGNRLAFNLEEVKLFC